MSAGVVIGESSVWGLLAAERLIPVLRERASVPLESRLGLGFQDKLEGMKTAVEASLRAGQIIAESGLHRYPALWRWLAEDPNSPLKGHSDLQVVGVGAGHLLLPCCDNLVAEPSLVEAPLVLWLFARGGKGSVRYFDLKSDILTAYQRFSKSGICFSEPYDGPEYSINPDLRWLLHQLNFGGMESCSHESGSLFASACREFRYPTKMIDRLRVEQLDVALDPLPQGVADLAPFLGVAHYLVVGPESNGFDHLSAWSLVRWLGVLKSGGILPLSTAEGSSRDQFMGALGLRRLAYIADPSSQVVIYQIPENEPPLMARLRDHIADILTQVG